MDSSAKDQLLSLTAAFGLLHFIVVFVHLTLAALATLLLTGHLIATYLWFKRFFQPEVWSALAEWSTVAVAVGAFLYAKQQVQEARKTRIAQEKQARESLSQQAKLSRDALDHQAKLLREQIAEQARIAQESLDEQAKQSQLTRDEMAQPNVVIYAEPLESDWQILEIIIRNFGQTPAYAVSTLVDSPFQSLPNNISDGKYYDIPIPVVIPILVPGQQWKTTWDSAIEREEERQKLRKRVIESYPGGPPTGTDIAAEVESLMPRSRHKARLQYFDSKGNVHHTESVLDFHMLDGSMRAKVYGIHDIAKKYVKGQ